MVKVFAPELNFIMYIKMLKQQSENNPKQLFLW